MKRRILLSIVAVLLLSALFTSSNVGPAHAAKWTLNLDAANTSTIDVAIATTGTNAHAFRIGTVVTNASTTNTLNVFGWQFTINYNATAFTPQGDPSPASSYPDGAANTALYGTQTTTGTANWQGKITAGQAFATTTD